MLTELNNEVTEAIKKNLPSAVADELKNYISEAQTTKLQLQQAIRLEEASDERYQNCSRQLGVAQKELETFQKREREFKESETKIAVALMKAAVSDAKLEGAMEVTRLVFSNNIIKRDVFTSGQQAVSSGPNSYPTTLPSSESRQEITQG